MKRIILTAITVVAALGSLCAQNYIVVNSEKIFKSIDSYNEAIAQLDKLAEEYQQQVDEKFKDVESLYNRYMAQKQNLTESARQSVETTILTREQEATKFQESLFGTDGELMKRRVELIRPIQEQVFKAIESYASAGGYGLVLDTASNPDVLYFSPSADHTEAVIAELKKR